MSIYDFILCIFACKLDREILWPVKVDFDFDFEFSIIELGPGRNILETENWRDDGILGVIFGGFKLGIQGLWFTPIQNMCHAIIVVVQPVIQTNNDGAMTMMMTNGKMVWVHLQYVRSSKLVDVNAP